MARILLAEDDNDLRHFLGRALIRAGHEMHSVGTGKEALLILAGGGFDLLLSDIVMPEIDGIELARRAPDNNPDIRTIFITGFAAVAMGNGSTTQSEVRSEVRVLSKPFLLRNLVDEIDAILAPDQGEKAAWNS